MKNDIKIQPQGFYLLVGSGRLATHLAYYFSHISIKFKTWNRTESVSILHQYIADKPIVLLAISDDALDAFYQQHLADHSLQVIHFSGAHHSERLISCHPLMTFGKNLYDLENYKKIPFGVTPIKNLQEIFPQLTNPSFQIKPKDKALYHALCVLSAAGAQTLWVESEKILSGMGVPKSAFNSYVQKITENYILYGSKALTGPWIRNDQNTISQNLLALSSKSDSLRQVYEILKEGSYDNS